MYLAFSQLIGKPILAHSFLKEEQCKCIIMSQLMKMTLNFNVIAVSTPYSQTRSIKDTESREIECTIQDKCDLKILQKFTTFSTKYMLLFIIKLFGETFC